MRFEGRRIFPLRFLLRHYPIRGQTHGRRKVLEERKGRFVDDELAYGWHRQYDHVAEPDHLFLRNPAALCPFDLDLIRLETLVQDGGRADGAEVSAAADPGAPVTGRGVLEQVSPQAIGGWAVREDGELANVELWDGPRLFATVAADGLRSDLAKQGIANGRGFTLRTPRELLDGRPHWIWATIAGDAAALQRSPLVLHATERLSLTGEREPSADVEV